MYLADTNIFLEALLGQDKKDDVQSFLQTIDDAYQYAVAAKYEMQLISFDTDFDRTERKRKEPIEVL